MAEPSGHQQSDETQREQVGIASGEPLFAGRFRLVRQIGAGGMGVVYEAWDDLLQRRVALKCAKPGHRNRLPPEVRAARDVSHFNVCKVHDIHLLASPEGATEFLSMEFISMEYIEGETLSHHIRQRGPLPPSEAKEIALQICAGLAQAHKQGVIHGDLKCGNILLGKTAEGGVRAVITDFGLAKFQHPDGIAAESGRGGTLDYMSPEILLGERASVASDLYALGVVFHVMLTGHTPERTGAWKTALPHPPSSDTAATTITIAAPKIVESNWKRNIAELPNPWKHAVNTCMEPNPQLRFASAEQVANALAPRRTFLKWTAAAVLVTAVALGFWKARQPPPLTPIRLAVLPFRVDGAAIPGALGVASDIANRLTGARRNFSIVSPSEALQNQVDTPGKARATLGATHALETTLVSSGENIDATASLIDLQSGQSLEKLKASYAASDQATLAKALIGTVTGALRLTVTTSKESVNDAAYPDYLRGMNLLEGDLLAAGEAIPFFEKAIALDPKSALPYAALARAQLQRFFNNDGGEWLDRAEVSVEKARSISPDSVRVLLVAGNVEQFHGRYEPAIRAFTRAAEIDPDETRAWMGLAGAYERSNQDAEAVATYQKAISIPTAGYAAYLNFGNFNLSRAQSRQAEEMYLKVTQMAPALAAGHADLGLALQQQGRFQEAEDELVKALTLRATPALFVNLGTVYYQEERYADALTSFQKGTQSSTASAAMYRNLGDAYRHLGRAQEASVAYGIARTKSEEEVARNPRAAASRARIAYLSAILGDRQRSGYELSQALALAPGNAAVMRDAVKTYEVLKQRDRAIAILEKAPRYLVEELSRQPDVKGLREDPRFQKLLHQ